MRDQSPRVFEPQLKGSMKRISGTQKANTVSAYQRARRRITSARD
jgi:hypothetical protein